MNLKERRKLSRQIERGLHKLYKAHKRAKSKAKRLFAEYQKTLKVADKLQEQRLLLLAAKNKVWEK